ncbi:DUF4431 domain-containing protein [Arenimonas terrae]
MCVDAASPPSTEAGRVTGIREIQLVQGPESPSLLHLRGRKIKVSGQLFSAHTGHHRTPVLLAVRQVSPN